MKRRAPRPQRTRPRQTQRKRASAGRRRSSASGVSSVRRIPSSVVEFFLLGRTRLDAIERYTQDGGIVTDVWLAFARDLDASQRVLVAPTNGTRAVDLGYALHKAITEYRKTLPPTPTRGTPGVSPLDNFVAV